MPSGFESDIFFGGAIQQVAPKKISGLKTQKPQGFTPKGTKNDRWAKVDTRQAGKRESKRLPLSCFFSLGQQFCSQNGWNLRKNSKSGEKRLYLSRFYAILYIIVDSTGEYPVSKMTEVKKKRKARTRLWRCTEVQLHPSSGVWPLSCRTYSVRSVISQGCYVRRQSACAPCLLVYSVPAFPRANAVFNQ